MSDTCRHCGQSVTWHQRGYVDRWEHGSVRHGGYAACFPLSPWTTTYAEPTAKETADE